MQPEAALWAWGLIQGILLLVLFCLPLLKLIPLRPIGLALYTAVFVTSFPLLHNTKWGQVSVLLTGSIVAAFHVHQMNRRVLAGVLIGFATAIKYYPAVFLLFFLLRRDLRVCISALIATAVFYALIPMAFMGLERWQTFEALTHRNVSAAGWVSGDPNSQYVANVVARWITLAATPPAPPLFDALRWGGYAIFLANMIMVWIIKSREERDQCVLSMTLLFLSLPFVIKTSWPHYFSYLP